MKTITNQGFALDFRPGSYFDGSAGLLSNIMGDWRREKIREALARGDGNSVPEALFANELDESLREFTGRIHPRMMGGEYLPPLLEEEVEIARVRMDSTTADVISIRARPEGDEILYRVVDEYESWEGGEYVLEPERSSQPLTLGELAHLINSANPGEVYGEECGARGIVAPLYYTTWEQGDGIEEARQFVRVGSEFYPEIEPYFDQNAQQWYELFESDEGLEPEPDEDEIGIEPWIDEQSRPEVALACVEFARFMNGKEMDIGALLAPDCRYESQIALHPLEGREAVAAYFQRWVAPRIARTFAELASQPEGQGPCLLMMVRETGFGRLGLGEVRSFLRIQVDAQGLIGQIDGVSLAPDPILCEPTGIYPGLSQADLRRERERIADALPTDADLDLVIFHQPEAQAALADYIKTVRAVARELGLPAPRLVPLGQVNSECFGTVMHPSLVLAWKRINVRLIERVQSADEIRERLSAVFVKRG